MSRPLNGYPGSIGAVAMSVFPHVGPSSYTQVTIAAGTIPLTGGDTVYAGPEAGLKHFDVVLGGVTDDGAFRVVAIPVSVSNPATGNRSGVPSTSYKLMWFANKTATLGGQAQTINTEAVAATDLSTFCVRLTAFGI